MKKYFLILVAAILLLTFTGCGHKTSFITKGEYYPEVYRSHPKTILILPARNTTTAVDAADYFRYTVTQSFAEKGYYIFPVHLVDSFFKSENISEAEIIRNIPISKLKEIFNADAVLYVDINAWDTGYTVFSSSVDVGLSFSLVDTKTGLEIWQSNAYAYSYQGLDGSNGLIGLLASAISVALNTGTDYTKLATIANHYGSIMLPDGIYGHNYATDVSSSIVLVDTAELNNNRLYVDEYFIFGNKKEGLVPLTARNHIKGYFGFQVTNMNFFNHNGYYNYYITHEINGKKHLRNRFFNYDNNKPYLLVEGKKVFVTVEADGKIAYGVDGENYFFYVDRIVNLKLPR